MLTGNAVAAAASVGVISSGAPTALKFAAIPCFLSFGVALICSVLMLTFYVGYLTELRGSGLPWAKATFSALSGITGLLSIAGFILGLVLAMHAVVALRGSL